MDEETLAAFFDGALDEPRIALLEHHLDVCDACRAVLARATGLPLRSDVRDARAATDDDVHRGPTLRSADDRAGAERMPGTRVGRYVVRAKIGAGAMGTVYAAHDPELDRIVALKVLRPTARVDAAGLRARMRREAQAMAKLAHPAVVTVHDVGAHGGEVFVAMELVAGGTLRAWLRARTRDWRAILAIFVDAGRGLAAAHAAGIIHRDFKPDNVLVRDGERGEPRRVCVTDFGLARIADARDDDASAPASRRARADDGDARGASLTRTGAIVGTPAYMAPEQIDGLEVDARADVFAFCASLYEALFGARPFPGDDVTTIRAAMALDRVAPPPGGSIPRGVRDAVLGGLRVDRAQRTASIDALLASLTRALARHDRARHAGLVALATALVAAVVLGMCIFAR